MIIVSQFVYT